MRRPWRHPAPSAAAADLCLREVGDLLPRRFARRSAASEDLVMRLQIHQKLDKHTGCVNTVAFNEAGDTLISGSDDQIVMLWDWDTGSVKLEFHSGHGGNVFQARFMPCTDDRTLVTCAADGEVRLAKIQDGADVTTTLLGEHAGRAHNLAIEPGNPYIFYSCGEDGLVQHFDLRTNTATELFYCSNNLSKSGSSYVHLNAITIDPRNPNLFAVGGSNAYARVYDIRKCKWDGSSDFDYLTDCYCPPHLIDDGSVGITGLVFSHQSELLVSYNDENIYLFPKNGGLGSDPKLSAKVGSNKGCKSTKVAFGQDVDEPAAPQAYVGHRNRETVKRVSLMGPNDEYVASGSDCGRIFIWRKRDGKFLRAMEGDECIVNCIEPHPHAMAIASSGIDNDVKIWTPSAIERAPTIKVQELRPRKRRAKLWHFDLPDLLIQQLLASERRQQASEEYSSEDLEDNTRLHNLVLRATDGGVSADDEESSEGAGDCRVN